MPELTPYTDPLPDRVRSRQTGRALGILDRQTLVRLAIVHAEGLVQAEKLREIDYLAREAMTGQALLRRWADTLAAGDPLMADELRVFGDLAKVGKADVMADTIESYCREARR
jgi:hypothetical protein